MNFRGSLFLFFLLISTITNAFAQISMESQPVGTSRDGVLVVYGSNNIGNNRIPYERISGTPLWKTHYIMATLIDRNNMVLGKAPVKLNLYTNEVYFTTPKGEERVAAPGKVRKIIFYKDDTSDEILAIFENNLSIIVEANPKAENSSYVQVMNTGDVQLLKHIKATFVTADSLFGTMKRYYFSEHVAYYVNNKFGQIQKLKKLNKDVIMENVNLDREAEAWIKQQNINFKKEEDLLRFLDYWNGRKKS